MPSDSLNEQLQHYNLLFDFYGELLTQKQREYFTMYYMEDNSLSEVGERCGVTPQAAADILKRTVKILKRYDDALGLIEKYGEQKSALAKMSVAAHSNQMNEVKRMIRSFPL